MFNILPVVETAEQQYREPLPDMGQMKTLHGENWLDFNIVYWFDVVESLIYFQLLKLLNSNTENPYLIWDNATRAQLMEYLLDQQQKMIKTVNVFYTLVLLLLSYIFIFKSEL